MLTCKIHFCESSGIGTIIFLLVHKSLLGHTPEYIPDLLTSVTNIPG